MRSNQFPQKVNGKKRTIMKEQGRKAGGPGTGAATSMPSVNRLCLLTYIIAFFPDQQL